MAPAFAAASAAMISGATPVTLSLLKFMTSLSRKKDAMEFLSALQGGEAR